MGGEEKMDGGGGTESGVSDVEAAAFAESQESIGLGTLGLTAEESAAETEKGVSAAYGMGEYGKEGSTSSSSLSGTPESMGGGTTPRMQMKSSETAPKIETPQERTGGGTESRKRRRSLLLEEEGGLLSPLSQAPVKRRSLFGT
jgi:hypothetical protein